MSIESDAWTRGCWALIAFCAIGLGIIAVNFFASAKAFDPASYSIESNPF